ncbi:MAG: molecular chaperone HtpG [Fibrobacterota bacterium]
MGAEKVEFKTEVKQILDLMIHSLYSHSDIFLRELVSNASDAIDKVRFESLKNKELLTGDTDLKIMIDTDKEKGTITVSDNGIGMDRSEINENLGTIARSGTKEFLKALKKAKSEDNPELIGQFGVGFYSSFMVAEEVTVLSKKAGQDKAVLWKSTGDGTYSVDDAEKDGRGTTVTVKLKEEDKNYLEEFKIKEIIKKYSDYIEHPVFLKVQEKDDKGKETGKTKDEQINSQKAIWLKNKSEISKEEYNDFYKHISHDWNEPSRIIHYSAEGVTEFKALLYMPSKKPFDLFNQDKKSDLHLYIKRVFITDDCKDLLPEYLRFVKGVVDSSDLPLNVSRETLQYNRMMPKLKKNLVTKVLAELSSWMKKERESYEAFFNEFGPVLKEGMHLDFENRDKIKDLLLYRTMNGGKEKLVSLAEYKESMKDDQDEMYYIIGESYEELTGSPHLEAFSKKEYDVIFMTDPVDEWVMQSLADYDGKKMKSASKGDIDLDTKEDKKEKKEKDKKFKKLLKVLEDKLKDDVKEIKLSNRLTDSSVCLVADDSAMGAHMERLMEAMNQNMPRQKRIMEINPDHSLIIKLNGLVEKDMKDPKLERYAKLLYEQALLTEGSRIPDPAAFSKNISEIMAESLSV